MSLETSWATRSLGDVADFINGDRGKNYPTSSDYVCSGIPFVSASDLDGRSVNLSGATFISDEAYDRLGNGKIIEGDILFCLRGSLGKIGLAKGISKGAIASSLVIIRPKEGVSLDFLFYILSGSTGKSIARELDNGSVQGNLSVRELKQVEVELPGHQEQKSIAHILGTLDDKIELNRKTNETLEAMAKALFKSWFVDFDPVRAKAEGRPTGLPAEISDLFPDSFEDSELGEIPSGWKISTLNDLIYLDSGLPYKGLLKGTGDSYLFTMGCADRMLRFKSDGVYAYPSPIPARHLVNPGDIVICSHDLTQAREQLGSPFVVPDDFLGDTAAAATNTFIVRRNSPNTSEYLYQIFRSKGFREQMIASAKGSVILHISKDSVLDYSFILPRSDLLLIAYQDATSGLIGRIQENSKSIQTLGKIRDALLPKLISGEIRIPDAEKMLEEVGI